MNHPVKQLLRIFTVMAALLLFGNACKKDTGPVIIPPVNNTPPPVSFANDIQPILTASCLPCHDQTHPYLDLETCCSYNELMFTGFSAPYIDTLNPSESLLYKRLTGEIGPTMPLSGPLNQYEIDLVLQWIEEGAKNN